MFKKMLHNDKKMNNTKSETTYNF